MKNHVTQQRPAAATRGETTSVHNESATTRSNAHLSGSGNDHTEPALPHEHDESRHSQARASEHQRMVGEKAYGNAIDGTADTDRGAEMDRVYNEKIAPDRGDTPPRQ